ncbi:MAG: hypothetical protein KBC02_00200 [Candidatus Pacebacteria bacterium]|nr:hypothetical protein [Candidatus Paceibacterota bacterium]
MYINQRQVERAQIHKSPHGFSYGFIENFIHEAAYENLRLTFPDVRGFNLVDKASGGGRKRFYVGPTYVAGKHNDCACQVAALSRYWQEFFRECASPATAELISKAVGISFNTLCNFGLTFGNEGCVQEPHIDGAAREYDESPVKSSWASIVYFNESPNNRAGTCVYEPDRRTMTYQAPSMRNGLFFFEQHPLAWHGFPKMQKGFERRILSLAYSSQQQPLMPRSSWAHRLTCRQYWKQFRP